MRLLIADDHQSVADGIGALLASQFDIICYAATPETAEQQLSDQSFDLLLLDLDFRRPDRTGFHILVAALQRDPRARVLILSQFDDPSLIAKARRLGAAGFLSKRSGQDAIQDAVRTVLNGGSWFPEPADGEPAFTNKQVQVMCLLTSGLDRKEIAASMQVSTPMIDAHLTVIQRKLGVRGLRATVAEIERRALHLLGC